MQNTGLTDEIRVIAERIREMREIIGFSVQEMADRTNLTAETYSQYESGGVDLPFTFIHKCALAFGIGITVKVAELPLPTPVAEWAVLNECAFPHTP